MKAHALQGKDDFSRGVWVSLGFHATLVIFFVIKNLVMPASIDDLPPAVRVDLVGLPDKIQTLAPPAAKPAESAPSPVAQKPTPTKPLPQKKDDAIKLSASKDKAKAALDKIKSMSALDRLKAEERAEAEKARLDALAAQARAAKIKGNIISPGTSLTGVDRLEHEQYTAAIDQHIKPHWQLPEWLARKGYKAVVQVRIDGRGQLISRALVRSSGNPDFDQSVLGTVDRSAPLPPPPGKFVAIAAVQGIFVEFGEGEQR